MNLSPADLARLHVDNPPSGGLHLVGAPNAGKSYAAANAAMMFGALYQPRNCVLVITKVLTQWREIWVPEIMQAAARAQMTPISEHEPTRTVHCGPVRFIGRDAKDRAAAKRMQGLNTPRR